MVLQAMGRPGRGFVNLSVGLEVPPPTPPMEGGLLSLENCMMTDVSPTGMRNAKNPGV